MKALSKTRGSEGAEIVSAGVPRPGAREVLAKTLATSICGTDVHIFEWDRWASSRIKPPLIIGHEFSAEVVDIGSDVTKVQVGDFVSAESHITCGQCLQCKISEPHLCQSVQIRGVDVDGCFAEFSKINEDSIWKNIKSMSPEVASAQEPFGTAVHAVTQANVDGKKVAIFGCGPIGASVASLCKALGALQIIAVDVADYRLGLAKLMGANATLNGKRVDPIREILDITDRVGVDTVFEISGAPVAMTQALEVARAGGEIFLVGISSKNVEVDFANKVIMKGIRIHGIFGRKIFETWRKTSELLNSGVIDLSKLITHRFKLEQFEEAFALMKSSRCGKIVMFP